VWLSKFLDFKDDLESLREEIEGKLFKDIKIDRLTPLEFTILERIFTSQKMHVMLTGAGLRIVNGKICFLSKQGKGYVMILFIYLV